MSGRTGGSPCKWLDGWLVPGVVQVVRSCSRVAGPAMTGRAGACDDPAIAHLHPPPHGRGDVLVVGDHHDGRTSPMQLTQQGQGGLPGGLIEAGRNLCWPGGSPRTRPARVPYPANVPASRSTYLQAQTPRGKTSAVAGSISEQQTQNRNTDIVGKPDLGNRCGRDHGHRGRRRHCGPRDDRRGGWRPGGADAIKIMDSGGVLCATALPGRRDAR